MIDKDGKLRNALGAMFRKDGRVMEEQRRSSEMLLNEAAGKPPGAVAADGHGHEDRMGWQALAEVPVSPVDQSTDAAKTSGTPSPQHVLPRVEPSDVRPSGPRFFVGLGRPFRSTVKRRCVGTLERVFRLAGQETTVGTEVRAGVVTFMTMSYIIFVQRALLGGPPPVGAGMDPGAVVVVTCLASALACFVMGLVANYPIALAPVMGENFFFVTVAGMTVAGEVVGWRVALTATFISGALFLLLSAFRVRERVFEAIPESLKYGISVGIGLFIAFIGLQRAGVIVGDPYTQVTLGSLDRPETRLALFGLAVTSALWARKVRGAFLLGIAATTLVGLFCGLVTFHGVASLPPSIAPIAFHLDFPRTLKLAMLPVVIVFLFMVLFDTIGTLIGVGEQAGLIKEGKLDRAGKALLADAVGTTAGAAMGSSTVSSYIESAAGVAEGGRTGLAAITTGVLFLLAIFFSPLVEMIGGGDLVTQTLQVGPQKLAVQILLLPVISPVMILVGCLMASGVLKIDWKDPTEALPAFLVILGMPLTYNIANGFALGFVSYPVVKLAAGRGREVSALVYALSVIFVLYFILLRY